MISKLVLADTYKDLYNANESPVFSDVLKGNGLDKAQVIDFIKDAEVLFLCAESYMPYDKEILSHCKNLKFVSIDTTDFSWIDVDFCKSKGIVVSNSPHVSTEAVAEQTLAYMLMLGKRIFPVISDISKGITSDFVPGIELKDKTIGIIGFGNIGKRVAELSEGFGMQVKFWNRSKIEDTRFKQVELDELLSSSDFISLHIALNHETKEFLDAAKIAKIKRGAIVVNISNKELVQSDSLMNALDKNFIRSYGVELWTMSEASEHKLFTHPKTLALPGIGWMTEQAIERTYSTFINNGVRYMNGSPVNVVS